MAIVSPSTLDALFQSFSLVFQEAYMSTAEALIPQIAMRTSSDTRDTRYPFMQSFSGAMREWKGAREMNNVVLDGFVVTNQLWEESVAIRRTDIEDDQYGAYKSMIIPNLARQARLLPDLQVANVINTNPNCFDGLSFFNSAHLTNPNNPSSSTYSNSLTGTPLNATNLAVVQQTFMEIKGPDGISLGNYGNVLLVPPSLKYVADTLANASYFPEAKNNVAGVFGSQTNVFQGQFQVVVSPYLIDSGSPTTAVWYLLDTRSPGMRPFMWQERSPVEFVSLVDPANPIVFEQDKFYFGTRMRGTAQVTLPFKAIKISGA